MIVWIVSIVPQRPSAELLAGRSSDGSQWFSSVRASWISRFYLTHWAALLGSAVAYLTIEKRNACPSWSNFTDVFYFGPHPKSASPFIHLEVTKFAETELLAFRVCPFLLFMFRITPAGNLLDMAVERDAAMAKMPSPPVTKRISTVVSLTDRVHYGWGRRAGVWPWINFTFNELGEVHWQSQVQVPVPVVEHIEDACPSIFVRAIVCLPFLVTIAACDIEGICRGETR